MPPAGLETAVPKGVQSQTKALDRSATGIGELLHDVYICYVSAIFHATLPEPLSAGLDALYGT